MVRTTRFGLGTWVAVAAAPLLLAAGALHAHGMMGMHGMGMMDDDDAKVTKEQFMQRSEQHFAHMDANKDGVLDASDRAAMRKRMQDCMGMMDGGGMGMGGGMQGGAAAPKQDHEAHHPQP